MAADSEAAGTKRPLEVEEAQDAKRPRTEGDELERTQDDDFDDLLGEAGDLDLLAGPPPVPAEETARRNFAERLLAGSSRVEEDELEELLALLHDEAPNWGALRHWRCAALFLACLARSSRSCRTAFVASEGGLRLLGQVLREAVAGLEGDAKQRQEAGMLALACLACLKALPLGRATLWEHRQAIGKPFDQLHRWCGRERSALAAELRAPTQALCRRWRRQPKPAAQEQAPELKALRHRVVEMISQGLQGIGGGTSPASPAQPLASPAQLPGHLAAVEVEAALWGHHGGAVGSGEYRQHARMLRANLALPGNAELRAKVLAGDLGAEELVAMDSSHLAPEALQKQRHEAELKAMRESVVEELVPAKGGDSPPRSPFDRSYDNNMAPRVWVSPSKDTAEEEKPKEAEPTPGQLAAHMLPPPTPFQDHAAVAATPQVEPPTPEMLATPAPDEEEEDEAALLRYLSSPP